MLKSLAAICTYVFGPPVGQSLHLAHVYLPAGQYVVGSHESGVVAPLTIEYSLRDKQAMVWRFQGTTFELIDEGTLRSFRAITEPLVKVSSRDAIQGLEVRSNSTYVHVIYNEDEQPYFLEFETNDFIFRGWIKRK